MFDSLLELLDRLDAVVDGLLTVDLAALDSAASLEVARRSAVVDRRLGAVRHRVVAALGSQGVATERGYKDTAALVQELWNVTPGVARREVALAAELAPRPGLSGAALAPIFPVTAAAEAAGELSAAHAKVIIDAVNKLPNDLAADWDDGLEADLVASARTFDPGQLAKLASRHLDHLDPDGTLREEKYRDQHRGFTPTQRADGSGHLEGELTAPCMQALLAVLDPLAGPAPAEDGTPDPRTAAQRRHDGLEAALRLVLRAKELPDVGGTVATVLLTATVDQWDSETGLVTTGHGSLISVAQAKRITGGDPLVVPVVIGKADGIIAYSTGQRLFNRHQRCAIYARDKGCTWPGCDAPPVWCEIHHVEGWIKTRRTSVDSGALLCSRHHQNLDFNGWVGIMINGRPHYVPLATVDPDQIPRRNTLHDTLLT